QFSATSSPGRSTGASPSVCSKNRPIQQYAKQLVKLRSRPCNLRHRRTELGHVPKAPLEMSAGPARSGRRTRPHRRVFRPSRSSPKRDLKCAAGTTLTNAKSNGRRKP
ncbi:MAG: hypothetical protein BJ554DRAFT_7097, partial [Olpidium bornovanus]